MKVLNTIISWCKHKGQDVISYEVDPRHAEIIIQDLGLQEAKPLVTPVVKMEVDDDFEKWDECSITKCKSIVARANYLVVDRPDIQYACKELSTAMSSPIRRDDERLKILGRYFLQRPRLVHKYWRQNKADVLIAHIDANWAGDRKTRKGISGGTISIGFHWIRSGSKT